MKTIKETKARGSVECSFCMEAIYPGETYILEMEKGKDNIHAHHECYSDASDQENYPEVDLFRSRGTFFDE